MYKGTCVYRTVVIRKSVRYVNQDKKERILFDKRVT